MSYMGYRFYIDDILLPITPSSFSRTIGNKNETATLMSGQEINILKKPGLGTFNFDFEIPRYWNLPYIHKSDVRHDAKWYTDQLYRIKNERKPVDFSVIRKLAGETYYNSNVRVTVEDYTINEDASNGSDFKITVTLKQYIDCGTKILNVEQKKVSGTNETTTVVTESKAREGKDAPKTYTVKKGDTLCGICKKMLNNGSIAKAKEIGKLNNISNINKIKVGQVIKLS